MDRDDREHAIRLDLLMFLSLYREALSAHVLGENPERVSELLADARPFGQGVLRRLLRREPTAEEVESLLRLDRPAWPTKAG